MLSESLKATEAECAEGRTAPRVSLADIEANISYRYWFTAGAALAKLGMAEEANTGHPFYHGNDAGSAPESLDLLTLCLLVTRNGFTIIGKSAPASADNFDAELGRKLAYEDAVRQLWPLMGYALREKLHQGEE